MNDIIKQTEKDIKAAVFEAAGAAFGREDLPDFVLETPGDRAHGDYAVNAAMKWAKELSMPPRKIGEAILAGLEVGGYIQSAEIAGPGFINIRLSDSFFADALAAAIEQGDDFGRSDNGSAKKIMVEFVSANPTGPMHIGNARGGALGDTLANVLSWAGYEAHKEFYVNDAGNQIERFALSLEARYLQIFAPDTPFPEDGYHGADIAQRAEEYAEKHGDSLMKVTADERRQALVGYALPLNIEGLRRDLKRYSIEYDRWFLESDLHKSGELDAMLNHMKSRGLTYEKDGAIWYKATSHGGEKDEVLVRQNGNPTYFAADIAYHYNKLVTRGFDRAVDIWGADHHGHVARMLGAMEAMGLDKGRLNIVIMQMVRLIQGGEVVKVSKRTGKSLTLHTLLDEVPIDAARFFFNMREPNVHLEFDLDLAVSENAQNPVYYVQYAHARTCSIMRNLRDGGIVPLPLNEVDLTLLSAPEERELTRFITALPGEIAEAAEALDSSRMTKYAVGLATMFHRFYNACRVHDAENPPLMQARMALCLAVRQTLKNVMSILNVSAPESM